MKLEPAFPHIIPNCQEAGLSEYWPGLTIRDYFAAVALQGIAATGGMETTEHAAIFAYQYADAMMKVRDHDQR